MGALPRILTVDPTDIIPQVIRGAVDLLDRRVAQVDMPGAEEAIEEVKIIPYNLVVTAWEPDPSMKGWELAAHIKRESEETAILILAHEDDPEMDEETLENTPFAYLQRTFDPAQFLRVVKAGLDGEDIKEAMLKSSGGGDGGSSVIDFGPVPQINADNAQTVIDTLLSDLGAMAIILSSRSGEVVLESGAVGYLDRDELTRTLLPSMQSNIQVRDIVGGNSSALNFYDGADHDVFVLSVGLHHFISVVFDGESGNRQFGSVNRYGRRAVEDLIAILGAEAWLIQAPQQPKEEVRRKSDARKTTAVVEEPELIELDRASFDGNGDTAQAEEAEAEVVSNLPQMEAIGEDDFDDLLGLLGGDDEIDTSLFDDLDNLQIEDGGTQGTLDWEQAQQLGLIGD